MNAVIDWTSALVSIITLGICYPFMACRKLKWKSSHTFIDGRQQAFDGKAGQYFGKRILWLFLTVITFGVYVFWLKIKTIRWTVSHTHIAV